MSEINDPVVDPRRNGKPWVTKSGLVVGGAYHRPMPQATSDGEAIQAGLLKQHSDDHDDPLRVWVGILAAIALALIVINPEEIFR